MRDANLEFVIVIVVCVGVVSRMNMVGRPANDALYRDVGILRAPTRQPLGELLLGFDRSRVPVDELGNHRSVPRVNRDQRRSPRRRGV